MASTSAVPVRSGHIRPKHVLFAALGLMFLFVLWHDERFLFVHSDPSWAYYLEVRWFIVPHGITGLSALLIGPFQLSSRFRQRHLRVHRILGRIYLSSVAVAGLMGMYLSYIHQALTDRIWIFALAITWLLTGAMALNAVLRGNIEVHRQWMIRNYAFTSVFVTSRVVIALPFIARRGDAVALGSVWALLLATLLFTEIGLSWRSTFTNRRARLAKHAASAE